MADTTKDDDLEGGKMPLLEHLIELRKRLMWSILSFLILFGPSWYFSKTIYGFLAAPLAHILQEHSSGHFIYTDLTEAFFTDLRVAFWTAICLSFPVIASQLWMFVAPGLYKKERLAFLPYLFATPVLFILGGSLAYFVIFLFDDVALWRRLFAFGWRVMVGVGVNHLMVITDGHFGKAWQRTLHSVTLARQPGMGWFELTNFVFHVPGKSDLNWQLALGFMIVMGLSGMAIAQWGRLEEDERLLFGMGLVPLMIPRILDYDMILIAPYAALLMAVAYRIGGGIFRFVLSWIFAGWMIWGILSFIFDMDGWHRTSMAMLLFGCLTVVVALRVVANRLGLEPGLQIAES